MGEEAQQEVQPQAVEEKGSLKVIIAIILTIVIISAGVLGYGFYNATKTKKFAAESEKIFNSSQAKWKPEEILEPGGDIKNDTAEVKTHFTEIKNDSESALTQIASLKETRKTSGLKTNLVRYYTLAKDASKNAIIIVDYMALMNSLEKDISPTIGGSSIAEVTKQLEAFSVSLDKVIQKLENAKTTPSIKKTNEQFIKALKEVSDPLDEALKYLKNNQPDKATQVLNSFSSNMSGLSSIKMPDKDEMQKDLLSDAGQAEINDLSNKIKGDIKDLKSVLLVY